MCLHDILMPSQMARDLSAPLCSVALYSSESRNGYE